MKKKSNLQNDSGIKNENCNIFENVNLSKQLSRLNLSFLYNGFYLKTYWFRTAIKEGEEFMNKKHAHSFYEIHICLAGTAEFVFENEKVVLSAGELIFIPKKLTHQINRISDDFVKIVWGFTVVVEEDAINDDCNEFLLINSIFEYKVVSCSASLFTILKLLYLNVNEKKLGWFIMVKSHLMETLLECVRLLYGENVESFTKNDCNNRMTLHALKRYIIDNMANGLTISEISRQFAISERHFYRICYREYGVSPKVYVKNIQMDQAKRMLEQIDLSIDEIAIAVGYADYYSFCKAFTREEGLSPSKFRASLLK